MTVAVAAKPSLAEMLGGLQNFGLLDYTIFFLMLLVCLVIGVYFGFYRAASSTQQYLMGERKMQTLPIALSLIASYISGISLLGIPTETYVYGGQFLLINFGFVLMAVIMHYIFMPVFFNLKFTSSYEYLENRFDKKVRLFGSFLCVIGISLWLPVVIYMPALAFNQITGINVHYITPIVCTICIFYTCVGGIKAVVWTDVVQVVLMYGAQLFIVIKGSMYVGGFSKVIEEGLLSSRIERPNFNLDLYDRHTVWSIVIGGAVFLLQTSAVNQSMIQRYMSLSSERSAKNALWLFVLGVSILNFIGVFIGLIIYAVYKDCDPITTQLAKRKDQLLPLLVADIFSDYYGYTGLFVSGVFSAALSSLSTGLNALAAIVLEDFFRSFCGSISEKTAGIIMKSTVVVCGFYCVALVFVVEKFGAVLQLSMSLAAIVTGPGLGLFTMGVLLPCINQHGALFGGLISLSCMAWLTFSTQSAIASGHLQFDEKPISIANCSYDFDRAINNSTLTIEPKEILSIYKLSYLWNTLIGTLLSMIFGILISQMSSVKKMQKLDPNLFAPFLKSFIDKRNDLYFSKEMSTFEPLMKNRHKKNEIKRSKN